MLRRPQFLMKWPQICTIGPIKGRPGSRCCTCSWTSRSTRCTSWRRSSTTFSTRRTFQSSPDSRYSGKRCSISSKLAHCPHRVGAASRTAAVSGALCFTPLSGRRLFYCSFTCVSCSSSKFRNTWKDGAFDEKANNGRPEIIMHFPVWHLSHYRGMEFFASVSNLRSLNS